MTTQTGAELTELARSADELRGELRRFVGGTTGTVGSQTITVNGAPASVTIGLVIALAVALGCCGYMAGALIGIKAQLAQNQADVRAVQDYMNVLYKRTADQKAKDDANRDSR